VPSNQVFTRQKRKNAASLDYWKLILKRKLINYVGWVMAAISLISISSLWQGIEISLIIM
jgi:hypothetical protein